ncbi:hypothetical protein DsansV1_C29g0213091 [Dioscorea sansibarensis]
MATVYETLLYHKMDRRLYKEVMATGRNPELARNIITLWMWLELIGIKVIYHLQDITTSTCLFLNFIKEAEAILNVIRQDSPPSHKNKLTALPFTAAFSLKPINLQLFYYHSDVVVRGLTHLLNDIGTLIFNEEMNHMFNTYDMAISFAKQQGVMRPPTMPKELAMQYNPQVVLQSSLEDHRSLFITFSKGLPLRREEIAEYFNKKLGCFVERVMMERTPVGVTPMYGRIVFVIEALIDVLLNGENIIKFSIKGRQVWGRKYIPRVGGKS